MFPLRWRAAALIALSVVAFELRGAAPFGGPFVFRGPSNLSGLTTAFLFDPDNPVVYTAGTPAGLWISSDEGTSWSSIEAMEGVGIDTIARNPVNHDVLYAGGVSGFYRSSDRGHTWTLLTTRVRPASIAVSADGSRLLVNSAFALWLSTDDGATWQDLLEGLFEGQVRFHPTDSQKGLAVLYGDDPNSDDIFAN